VIDRNELIETLPRLRRYARLLTGDRWRADDLVQDAVQRALERESTFRSEASLRPWLFSLVHNLFVDDGARARSGRLVGRFRRASGRDRAQSTRSG
jgi:RNA polymerase sigma-70 factor (ECF subfamily)